MHADAVAVLFKGSSEGFLMGKLCLFYKWWKEPKLPVLSFVQLSLSY